MQLHPNSLGWKKEVELLKTRSVIGLGDWDETGKNQQMMFEKTMAIGDIVAIKRGGDLIALVEVTSNCDRDDLPEDLAWFPRRRHVKVLDWYKPEYNYYVSPRGTLTRCNTDSDAATTLSIQNWYKQVNHKKEMQQIVRLLEQKRQIILQGSPGTGKTYTAKNIAEHLIFGEVSMDKEKQRERLEATDQFMLVQFHPSYSYEDFVRGITAFSDGGQVEYKTENKVFGKFAAGAYENYIISRMIPEELSLVRWIDLNFNKLLESIEKELAERGKFAMTNKGYIFEIAQDCLRYKGDDWSSKERINFSELKDLIRHNLNVRENKYQVSKEQFTHAWYRKTYYFSLLEKFFKISGEYKPTQSLSIPEKKFCLVIDEINRANLPSVLGELIYALEYRGEKVETMYDIDGIRSLIIPKNLFIIGTMNTADRSVGHIDYAIRRRFSLVDILPSPASVHPLASNAFRRVSDLFIKNYDSIDWNNPVLQRSEYLASDFRPEDIWIGHSYFMSNKVTDEEARSELKLKLSFEILPLLKEYLKDGIFVEKASYKIKEIKDLGI